MVLGGVGQGRVGEVKKKVNNFSFLLFLFCLVIYYFNCFNYRVK